LLAKSFFPLAALILSVLGSIMFGLATALFIAGVLMRDKIISRLQRLRHGRKAPPPSC